MPKQEPIISFRNFTFQYFSQKEPTLYDINLDICPGEKVLIVGPSGCGKSTLAHCINGLIPYAYRGTITGSLLVDGKTVECEGLGILLVNFPRIQFEIPLTHGSDARDGELEVAILKAENAFGLIPALMAGIMDRDGVHPDRTESMEIHRGRVIEAYADPPFEIQYDGELPGITTPFRAHVVDNATRFIVSDAAVEAFS